MKKILIIDDDQRIVMAMAARLKSEGFEVIAAYDGISATSIATKQRPDLILMDINMPAGDGLTIAGRLNQLATTVGTPLIFMTASKEFGLRQRAAELGAIGFFEKPFDSKLLVEMIRETLGLPIGS